jgi:curved DNA-binding protein CbpA
MATLYETLGVRIDATRDEIKAAYRKAVMKWHPDRNAGREEQARAAFLEVQEAYAILSDPLQRKVYDAVYADEMRRFNRQQAREARAQAERAAQAQAAAEDAYAENVKAAMRFAEDGHHRDVLFGVLLGRDCEAPLASRIADSVWALHESRKAEAAAAAAAAEPAAEPAPAADPEPPKNDARPADERHTGMFHSLWQSFFGVRS